MTSDGSRAGQGDLEIEDVKELLADLVDKVTSAASERWGFVDCSVLERIDLLECCGVKACSQAPAPG